MCVLHTCRRWTWAVELMRRRSGRSRLLHPGYLRGVSSAARYAWMWYGGRYGRIPVKISFREARRGSTRRVTHKFIERGMPPDATPGLPPLLMVCTICMILPSAFLRRSISF